MAEFAVEAPGLQALIGSLELTDEMERRAQDAIARGYVAFALDLKGPAIEAPGAGLWPVGEIANRDQVPGEHYASTGRRKGRSYATSGRSLNAWQHEQDGLTVRAWNDAKDAYRRPESYSLYVHKSGREPGSALEDAEAAWDDRMSRAGEDAARSIQSLLDGGR